MIGTINLFKKDYDKMIKKDVLPAFKKFDTDGSDAIDKGELQKLSLSLGYPLSEEQTKAALKDLDLNKDGVIDFNEFSRWYFTGMKSYNGTTRNMMKIGNKSKALLEKLKGQEIFEMINEDNRLSKHKIGISFN